MVVTSRTERRARGFAVAGLVAAAWSVFVFPYVLGPAGMICGAVAYALGERRGRWVVALAALGTVLGILLALLPQHFVES